MSASAYKEALLKIFVDLNGQQQQNQQEEVPQNINSNDEEHIQFYEPEIVIDEDEEMYVQSKYSNNYYVSSNNVGSSFVGKNNIRYLLSVDFNLI